MEEFVNFPNSLKRSISFVETEHGLDSLSQFDELNCIVMENSNLGLMCYSNDDFPPLVEYFSSILQIVPSMNSNTVASIEQKINEDTKRKSDAVSKTPSLCTSEYKKKNCSGSAKRGKRDAMEMEKPLMEVVHVRARRGQATDSHSLAERVRREKINERMRCLEGLVPGCCKTMGMAGMLDEIINYVHSLQNQIEFLSMKLSAASSMHDFRQDMENTTSTSRGGRCLSRPSIGESDD